ncbi:MAG: AAA family ATPase [Planctomycetes bacterium]|nr:AAA family ATPase [Planctomycetota bacterium]
MSVISIVNPKKGTGKSTTAVSLAAGLARRGWRVLLVDLDPQAACTSGVGLTPESLKVTAFEALFGPRAALPEAITKTSYSGLEVLPANVSLGGAESQPTSSGGRQETVLHMQLSTVREEYDFIIVDSPPSCGLLTSNAIVAADQLIVPVVRGSAFRDDIAQLMDLISRLMGQGNPITGRIDWLWTFHQPDVQATGDSFESAQKEWNAQAFNTLIRKDTSFQEAAWAKKPIFYYRSDAPGAQDYKDMVLEVLKANDLSGTSTDMPAVPSEGQITATPQGLTDLVKDIRGGSTPNVPAATMLTPQGDFQAALLGSSTPLPGLGLPAATLLAPNALQASAPAGMPGAYPGAPSGGMYGGMPMPTQMMSPPDVARMDPLTGQAPTGQVTAPFAGGPASPMGQAAAFPPTVAMPGAPAQATQVAGGGFSVPMPGFPTAGPTGVTVALPVPPGSSMAATGAAGYGGETVVSGSAAGMPGPGNVTATLSGPPVPVAGETQAPRRAAASGVASGRLHAGVDIGGASVHVVQLRVSGRKPPVLSNFALERIPDVPDEELEIALARTLRAMKRKSLPGMHSAHCNISGNSVVVKPFSRPTVGEKEISETLRWQHLAKGLPFSPDTALIRYCNKRAEGEEVGGRQKIFGCAADPERVELRTSAVQRAGLAVQSVTPDVFALENLVRRSKLVAPRQAAAVLNVGFASTVLAVYGSAGLEFCRDIGIGAKDLLGLEASEPNTGETPAAEEGAAEVKAPEKKSTKRFVSEIMMSLEYFHQSVRTMRVEQVYLCGIRAQEILEFLVDDLQVELLDPWRNIDVPEELRREAKAYGPALAVAVGLALQDEPRIDFLLPRGRLSNALASLDRVINVVGIGVCLMVLVFWWAQRSSANQLENLLTQQRDRNASLKDQLKKAREFELLVRELKRKRKYAEQIVPRPIKFYGILVEIANLLHHRDLKEKLYLKKIVYPAFAKSTGATTERLKDAIEIHASVAVESLTEFSSIREPFWKLLGKSPFFLEANPDSFSEEKPAGQPYNLRVTCTLKWPKAS